MVYIPDGSVIIAGGIGYDLNTSKADVYHFDIETNELYRRSSMLERREGLAIIYRHQHVYVLGGRFGYNTCEKYSIQLDR